MFPRNKESNANYPSTDDESFEPGRLLGGPHPYRPLHGGTFSVALCGGGGQGDALVIRVE